MVKARLESGKIEWYSCPFARSINQKVVKMRFYPMVKWVQVVKLKGAPLLPYQIGGHQSKSP